MTPVVKEAMGLIDKCRPLLAGKHPAAQGAALADLLATWIAGHPPEIRDELLAHHIAAVKDMIPISDHWPERLNADDFHAEPL